MRSSFNFQDLNDINYVCLELLKLEFINMIKNMGQNFDGKYCEENTKKLSKHWKKFDDVFAHRHKITCAITYYRSRHLNHTESVVELLIFFIEFSAILFSLVGSYPSGELKDLKIKSFIDEELKEKKE